MPDSGDALFSDNNPSKHEQMRCQVHSGVVANGAMSTPWRIGRSKCTDMYINQHLPGPNAQLKLLSGRDVIKRSLVADFNLATPPYGLLLQTPVGWSHDAWSGV